MGLNEDYLKNRRQKKKPERMILSGFRKCHEKTNTSLYVGIYYLQWRLVELPTSITRRLIAVYIYDAHSSPKIQNSFCEVVHSRRMAAR
jgi:hypothetical protein